MSSNIIRDSIKLAEKLQEEANRISSKEKGLRRSIIHLLENPRDKAIFTTLLDRSFRSTDALEVANQIRYLLKKLDDLSFFSFFDRMLIRIFLKTGMLANLFVSIFKRELRMQSKDAVIPKEHLRFHLIKRKSQGFRVNVNIIGEDCLGEQEVKNRTSEYLDALKNPLIDYMSIKISTIFSQISILDREYSKCEISKRLSVIFREAMKNKTKDRDGKSIYKFVNLDMETYGDLELSISAFTYALNRSEFLHLKAGIVLQAYVPESFTYQKVLTDWSKDRVKRGGAPIKIRIVKGANMQMEHASSSIDNMELPIFLNKSDTDANYKRMIKYGLIKQNAKFVHIGVASHNIFDVSYACQLAKVNDCMSFFDLEFLEGIISENVLNYLANLNINIVLYAPTSSKEKFVNSIAYLMRRFDEATTCNNFLRYSFDLEVNSKQWQILRNQFLRSLDKTISNEPLKKQNRLLVENIQVSTKDGGFNQVSDTDFTISANRKWAKNIKSKYKSLIRDPLDVPIVVRGDEIFRSNKEVSLDKSQRFSKIGVFSVPNKEDVRNALACARADFDNWCNISKEKRFAILSNVAKIFAQRRGDLIGIAASEVGKTFEEVDAEVSEAIDFLNFYPYSIRELEKHYDVNLKPKGAGVVISPWNFPIAIPTGGIAASLATGNCVILKPSRLSAITAYFLCKCFWDGGVSKKTLQYLPCNGYMSSKYIVPSNNVDFIIFTGSEKTAYKMLEVKPDLSLSAETGGKNVTIVTNISDKEQAIKNICYSAFSNSGQKCSATSLLILLKQVYENDDFKNTLADAIRSINVGSVWNFSNFMGTLSKEPNPTITKAITTLDEQEEWIVKPEFIDIKKNGSLMLKPSLKYGTKVGNFTYSNELFAPILSVMSADNLEMAIDIANSTGYGLTAGLESLDEREQEYFKENIYAGNIYINRPTTGAIVYRQPFGGFGKSSFGTSRKAGGMNYVTQFCIVEEKTNSIRVQNRVTDCSLKTLFNSTYIKDLKEVEMICLRDSIDSYSIAKKQEFNSEHKCSNLLGEDNVFRYKEAGSVLFRVYAKDSFYDVLAILGASKISNAKITISVPYKDSSSAISFIKKNKDTLLKNGDFLLRQTDEEFCLAFKEYEVIRFASKSSVSMDAFKRAATLGKYIITQKPVFDGRFELLNYHKEQSVSIRYHRYGNLSLRV